MSLKILNTNQIIIDYLNTNINNDINFLKDYNFKGIESLSTEVRDIFKKLLQNINIISNITKKINTQNLNFFDIIQILFKKGILQPDLKNKLSTKEKAYKYFIVNKKIYDSLIFHDMTNIFSSVGLNDYPNEILNVFISPYIFDKIIKLQNITEVKSSYKSNKLTLKIYHKDNDINNFQINIILITIYTLLEYYRMTNKNLHIEYFFTDLKKQLDQSKKEKVLTSSEINSGVTIHYFGKKKIFIYRKEEVEKLSIHEMIHALEIDKNILKYPIKYDNLIKCHYNINHSNDIRIYEAFTETTAVLLNIVIDSLLTKKNVQDLLMNEINFNIFQCKKIMNYFNTDKLFTYDTCTPDNLVWKENTSVLSYFFFKTIGLLNSNYFINNIMNNVKIDNYYHFLKNNTELLVNILDNIRLDYNFIPSELIITMRMTINNYIFNYN